MAYYHRKKKPPPPTTTKQNKTTNKQLNIKNNMKSSDLTMAGWRYEQEIKSIFLFKNKQEKQIFPRFLFQLISFLTQRSEDVPWHAISASRKKYAD